MKFINGKILRACANKWQKRGCGIIPSSVCDACCRQCLWASLHEERSIPKDVPKGHMVIYVGKSHKRFVIKINLLEHPLFKTLLDQTHDVYDLPANSKLCISCDETFFLSIIQCIKSSQSRRTFICL